MYISQFRIGLLISLIQSSTDFSNSFGNFDMFGEAVFIYSILLGTAFTNIL